MMSLVHNFWRKSLLSHWKKSQSPMCNRKSSCSFCAIDRNLPSPMCHSLVVQYPKTNFLSTCKLKPIFVEYTITKENYGECFRIL
jgi:hypothetical protein